MGGGAAREPVVEVRLLGEPGVVVDGRSVGVSPGKQQAILVALALQPGSPVSADRLIDALWGEYPPASVQATLRGLVSRLRLLAAEADPSWLARRGAGYVLDLPPGRVDADRFGVLVTVGRAALTAGDPDAARIALLDALGLWRGCALGAVAELDFAWAPAARLEESRLDAVEDAAAAELALGLPGDVVARLEPHVSAHPSRERGCGLLMRALYGLGRQADALMTYRRLKKHLAEELGIDPTPALRELETAILQQRPDLDRTEPNHQVRHPLVSGEFPPLRARRGPRTNLPSALSSFVGRAEEVAAVADALTRTRLVTLAGSGGAGKTRLALQAAGRVSDAFPDGTWLADLTPLGGPDLVAAQVAAAVSLDVAALAASGRPLLDALCDQLRHRRLLLVLDNCEHLVEAAAGLTHALLASSPGVVVLATSREVLGVPGESVVRVAGLGLPAPGEVTLAAVAGSEAGELFCARAMESTPGFALTEANAEPVARICRRLDGIPLALELAAARIRLLGAHRLAARLDGLQLLSGGPRTAAARHRTLEAAIEWSHNLLPETERVVLRRLSVFPAPWTLAAAEAVSANGPDALDGPPGAEVLDLVGQLIDKSLVLPVPHDGTDEPRYRLLETIRQFAAARLAEATETDVVRARHRDFLIAATAGWTEVLYEASWLRWVDREIDGIRAVLAWSADRDDEAAILKLAAPLWTYWEYSGTPAETIPWLERAVAAPPEIDAMSAVQARIGLVRLLGNVGGSENLRREPLLLEAQELAAATGETEAEAWAILFLGDHWARAGRWAEAERLFERLGDKLATPGWAGAIWIDMGYSMLALSRGDVVDARRSLRESVAREIHRPDSYLGMSLLALLGLAEAGGGDAEAARRAAEASVRAARGIPGPGILVMALVRAVEAALLSDATAWARGLLDELLTLLRDLGSRRWVAESLELAAVQLATADPRTGAACLGAATALRAELHEGGAIVPALSEMVAAADTEISSSLSPEADAAARRYGAALYVSEILALARQALVDLN